jgi:NAD(P)H-hydrate epimerase
MKIVTSKEMREIDRRTIEGFGVSGLALMERAGLAVAKRVREVSGHKVIVLAGSGNNGGDGLVVARNLHNDGYNVKVLLAGKKERLSPDCLSQYRTAVKMGVPVEFRALPRPSDLHSATVVDALFGTGLDRDLDGDVAKAVSVVNASRVQVVSVDIPSGVSADTGRIMGAAIKASCTVTFGIPKRGQVLYPGAAYTGKLYVEDIGFPRVLTESSDLKCNLVDRGDAAPLLPERRRYSHKGDYGHVFIVAGSRGKTGAALMAARACMRAGAGLVTIGVPESLTASFEASVIEEMLLPLPDTGEGALSYKALDRVLDFLDKKADVLAIGPGLGTAQETGKLVTGIIGACTSPMLVDADGINAIDSIAVFKRVKAPVIITPHPGEFSRLSGRSAAAIEKDRIEASMAFSRKTGAYIVLKGVPTVTAEPEGRVFINSTGNPGMAKAGAGDVLTGVISSMLAQGLGPLEASVLGVYLHGLAGDISADGAGLHSVIASDLIGCLPAAFKALRGTPTVDEKNYNRAEN